MSLRARTVTTGILAAICASSIIGTGALSANAEPVSPTVTGSQTYVSFVVPEPGSYNRSDAPFSGGVGFGSSASITADDFAISIGCDNGQNYEVAKGLYTSNGIAYGVFFTSSLPLEVVGHSCTLTMTESHGRPVWFKPVTMGNDKGKTATAVSGSVVYRSSNGGL